MPNTIKITYQYDVTKIIHNNANVTQMYADISCILSSIFESLNAGVAPTNNNDPTLRNAVNCQFDAADISNQHGIKNIHNNAISAGNNTLRESCRSLNK
jgi:hypothetical protein